MGVTIKNKTKEKRVVVGKLVGKKKSSPKRKKAHVVEDVEEDVVNNLNDIVVPSNKKIKKIVGGKKIPDNVPVVPLENILFH